MEKLESTEGSVKIQLKRPGIITVNNIMLIVGVICGNILSYEISARNDTIFWVSIAVANSIALLIALILVKLRAKNATFFEIKDNVIFFPVRHVLRKSMQASVEQISFIDVIKNKFSRVLLIGIDKKLYPYPSRKFVDENAVDQIKSTILSRIKEHQLANELLCGIRKNICLFYNLKSRKPVFVILVSVYMVAVSVVQYLCSRQEIDIIALGANASLLVKEGQWFRLLTASFLHAGPVHLGLNLLFIFPLGSTLERLIGTRRLFILYITSAVGGGIVSTLTAEAAFSAGASPAAFGLLGSLALLNLRFRRQLPFGYEMSKKWWVVIIGMNAILPIIEPRIDIGAHIGGFLTGVAITWLMYFNSKRFDQLSTSSRTLTIVCILTAVLSTIGIARGITYAFNAEKGGSIRVIKEYVGSGSAKAEILNSIAKAVHTDPRASLEELQIAKTAANRAVAAQVDNADFINTLAISHYLVNEIDDAIIIERMIFEKKLYTKKNKHIFARQMTRFLLTKTEASLGPLLIGDALPDDITIKIFDDDQGRKIVVELSRLFPDGFLAYALVSNNGQPSGVLHISGGGKDRMSAVFSAPSTLKKIPDNSGFNVAVIDASGCDCREWKISFYKH